MTKNKVRVFLYCIDGRSFCVSSLETLLKTSKTCFTCHPSIVRWNTISRLIWLFLSLAIGSCGSFIWNPLVDFSSIISWPVWLLLSACDRNSAMIAYPRSSVDWTSIMIQSWLETFFCNSSDNSCISRLITNLQSIGPPVNSS